MKGNETEPKIGYFQDSLKIQKKRGFHVITNDVLSTLPNIKKIKTGMLNLFLQHTSAGLMINESWDSNVLLDTENFYNKICPESKNYIHNYEGADDMPAHLKCGVIGCSVNIPITDGALNMGTWQGVILCEFRDNPSQRTIIVTAHGTLL